MTREDGMMSDATRWGEGREVVEKRVVQNAHTRERATPGLDGREIRNQIGPGKLARRQSWGKRAD